MQRHVRGQVLMAVPPHDRAICQRVAWKAEHLGPERHAEPVRMQMADRTYDGGQIGDQADDENRHHGRSGRRGGRDEWVSQRRANHRPSDV